MTVNRARTLSHLVDHYVERRSKSGWPISTGHAIVAIRMVAPDCAMSDRQLSELVAASAIRQGCNVTFEVADEGVRTRQIV